VFVSPFLSSAFADIHDLNKILIIENNLIWSSPLQELQTIADCV
jgi:hypothetical protein